MATAWLPLASVTLRGSIVAVVSASATLPSASPAPRLRGGVRPHGAAFPAQDLHDAFGLERNHIRSMADRRHRPRDPVSHRSVGHLHRPDPGPRAQVRVFVLAAALATMLVVPAAGQQAAPLPFEEWRAGLMAEARARGFSDALVNEALAGVEPCEQVISEDRNQAEVVQTLEQYYRIRVSPTMVEHGRALAGEHAPLLARIEAEYGVPRRFILAIWGMESQFGRITGGVPVFQALATLAWDPRRAELFRGEIFAALSIVANGDITVAGMTGSWASAIERS